MKNRDLNYRLLAILLAGLICYNNLQAQQANAHKIDLSGTWQCRLDSARVGIQNLWYLENINQNQCQLPGTTNKNKLGNATVPLEQLVARKTLEIRPDYAYEGLVWYQREIEVPEHWDHKQITLFLERCSWETGLWIDSVFVGTQFSLVAPHVYNITDYLQPGSKHMLTLTVDNSVNKRPSVFLPDASRDLINLRGLQMAGTTQTNWNGIIGRLEIMAHEPVWIERLKTIPNIETGTVKVELSINNTSGGGIEAELGLSSQLKKTGTSDEASAKWKLQLKNGSSKHVVELKLDKPLLWDEFEPHVYQLEALLKSKTNAVTHIDRETTVFGMREIGTKGTQFTLNGNVVFLRGNLDCAQFPLTGYSSMEREYWEHSLGTQKAYGLNHVRFHTWCPPEVAFRVADSLGMILELGIPDLKATDTYSIEKQKQELFRAVDTYGNHPSFCLMSMGNEDKGEVLKVSHANMQIVRDYDSRFLYTSTNNMIVSGTRDEFSDDYFPSAWGTAGTREAPLCGIIWGGHSPLDKSHFCMESPSTTRDNRKFIEGISRPILTHESGQWHSYPDISRVEKYTGILRPDAYDITRKSLEKHHLLAQAKDFVNASGQLSLILYKEEIEMNLRTPDYGGFQLLGLYDNYGWGLSLVGILDEFWDSKGWITPEEFRRFNSATVPLLRMEKRAWTTAEAFTGIVEIAHYGKAAIKNAKLIWRLEDEKGNVVKNGNFPKFKILPGQLNAVSSLEIPLNDLQAPAKYRVKVQLPNTEIRNDWDIWVYPGELEEAENKAVILSRWDDRAKDALDKGKSVLLLVPPDQIPKAVPGVFTTAFWGPALKNKQPGTEGILCDPRHPVFNYFPTTYHTNWQWWDLIQNSSAMVLDDSPADYRPVVQVIPNFLENQKLGMLFEAKVGNGKLIVCSIDLETNIDKRITARQFRYSLIKYLNSVDFIPGRQLESVVIDRIFKQNR